MATTTRSPKGRTPAKRSTTKTTPRSRKPVSALESARETAGGYAGDLIETIRARPLAAAAVVATTAGAAALLWAQRKLIGEQASVARSKIGDLRDEASEKASELREDAGEKAKAFRGKLNERFFATEEATDLDPETEVRAAGDLPTKSQAEIAQEALTLKQLGEVDPLLGNQSKVGAIAY